jgi:hypothetical protein
MHCQESWKMKLKEEKVAGGVAESEYVFEL